MSRLADLLVWVYRGVQCLLGITPESVGTEKQNEKKESNSGLKVIFVSLEKLNKGLRRLD